MTQNPNRYAEGLEATLLRTRLEDQQLALDVLAGKYLRAQQGHAETHSRFRQIEEQYLLYKSLLRDSETYVSQSKLEYDSQTAAVAATRAFFHPIRKAPLDVLGLIFELCSNDFSLDGPLSLVAGDIAARQIQPFRLAAVCRRWREASLASPRAWSHVEISFDGMTGSKIQYWAAFLDTVLSRARSAPLDLCLVRVGESQHHHSKVVRRLVTAMPQVARAQLMFCQLTEADSLLPILTAKTPRLHLAHIDLARAEHSDVLETIRPFPHTPMLKSLHADNVFQTCTGGAAFPVLERACYRYLDCSDDCDVLSYLLRAAPNLRELRLDWPNVTYQPSNKGKLTVPKVTALTLEIANACPVHQILHRVDFSGLTSVSLCGDPPSTECRLQFLRALPRKAQINKLTFTDIGGSAFRLLLDELPSLKSLMALYFDCSAFKQDNLVALHALLCPSTPAASWPCKRLRTICFKPTCTFTEDCDASVFLAIVSTRGVANEGADAESPDAIERFCVHNWETPTRGPIQSRIDHAIRAAAGASAV